MTSKPLCIIDFSLPFKIASFFTYYVSLLLVVIFDHLVFRVRIEGRRNLSRIGRAILVSNHTLFLDPGLVAHAIAPRRTYYSAMEPTFRRRFIGPYIRLLGAFPLPDSLPLARTLKHIRRALDERGFVHFFPEGELEHFARDIRPFSDGAFYVALLLNVPVVPITTILRARSLFGCALAPRVRVVVGAPYHPTHFRTQRRNRRDDIARMRECVREAMRECVAGGLTVSS